jgi:hypothetical protein
VESPRTLCPRDKDHFNFDKEKHLTPWDDVPGDLRTRLPEGFQSTVAYLQHAGADVLAAFERMDQHDPPVAANEDDVFTDHHNVLPAPIVLPRMNASFTSSDLEYDRYAPVFSSQSESSRSSTPSLSASAAQSQSQSQIIPPVSPICLTPSDSNLPRLNGSRPRAYSFTTPLEPNNHYYVTELSEMRTNSVPRLVHARRNVEREW